MYNAPYEDHILLHVYFEKSLQNQKTYIILRKIN